MRTIHLCSVEVTFIVLLVVAAALLYAAASTRWNLTLQNHRSHLAALAQTHCPACSAQIGKHEAEAASDRSDAIIRGSLVSTTSAGEEGYWPVVCPACSVHLVFWTASREIHTAAKLVSEGWLREHDLNFQTASKGSEGRPTERRNSGASRSG